MCRNCAAGLRHEGSPKPCDALQTNIPQMDFGWTLLHAADDECTAVGSVDQGFSGSGKHSEPPRHLKSAANTIRGADLPLWNS
jgi:hypothetical protein